ncbi:hypothetical protein OS176_07980 [Xanthomonadaceae bacterium XH05]|nr:hypothetical protein [Xanthomonadaceae bacterium XH05]
MITGAPGPSSAFALLMAMVWLLGEQGLSRATALRHSLCTPRQLARLLVGAILLGAMASAALTSLTPGLPVIVVAGGGFGLAMIAALTMLHRRRHPGLPALAGWIASLLALCFAALACIARTPEGWMLGGSGVALLSGVGLPAFAALAHRLDDSEVPAAARGLPSRALAASTIALAIAGCLSW